MFKLVKFKLLLQILTKHTATFSELRSYSRRQKLKVSAAKDKCRISRHRVEVDQIAINLDGTTIVDTTINPLLLPIATWLIKGRP